MPFYHRFIAALNIGPPGWGGLLRWLGVQFLGEAVGEFEGGDEAGLLVQAAEVTGKVDDGILFLEGFIGQGVIEVVEGLVNLVGVLAAVRKGGKFDKFRNLCIIIGKQRFSRIDAALAISATIK